MLTSSQYTECRETKKRRREQLIKLLKLSIEWKKFVFVPYSLRELGTPCAQRMNASPREVSHNFDNLEAKTVILGSLFIEPTTNEKVVY